MDSEQKKNLTIFISGLPYVATEDEIREFFSNCGEITYLFRCYSLINLYREMKLPRFQDSGRLLGYGHITFDSEEARQSVILILRLFYNSVKGFRT